jgi:MFS family permease
MSSSSHPTSAGLCPYWLVLTILILTELVAALENSMIYAALPRFYQILNNPLSVGWVLTAYMLVSAVFAALCSQLGDMYGRRRILLCVVTLAGAGSVVSALSTSLDGIIGRAVQGAAGAILPLCFGLARENVATPRLPFAVAVIGSAAGIGSGLGFLIGGLVVDYLVWQWLFSISAGLSALVVVLVLLVLPASKSVSPTGKLDVLGGVLFAPAIAALLLGLSMGHSWGWLDAGTLGLAGGGALLLAVWWRHQLRQTHPLLDVRLLANRQVALANLGFFLLAVGAMNIQSLTILLQQPAWTGVGLGVSATLTGILNLLSVGVAMLAGTLCGYLAKRHGGRLPMLAATRIAACAWIALLFNHASVPLVVGMLLLTCFGTTMAFGATANLVVQASAADRTSEATGLTQVIRAIGMAIGSQVLAMLMASSTISDPAHGPGRFPDAQAYQLTFGFVAVAALLAFVSAWLLPHSKSRPHSQPITHSI